MRDDDIGRAIDTIAREMTAADVSPAFKARVLEGVTAQSGRRVFMPAALGLASAVAMVVLAAVVWMAMDRRQPQAPETSASMAPLGKQADEPQGTAPAVTVPAVDGGKVRGPARVIQQVVRRGNAGLAWEAGPAPLPMPDPISIDALEPAALDIPAIEVMPMAEIQPITILPAGPGLPDAQRRDRE